MTVTETGLSAGFAAPVSDAQASFRAVLEAMSRPGRIVRLRAASEAPAPHGQAAAALLLTLADSETPVWTDAGAGVSAWLGFHCGCPFVDAVHDASFVLATGTMPALASLRQGTEEAPQGSATLVAQVAALEAGAGWRLSGPGIEGQHRLRVAGAPEDFLAQWAARRARFPLGVDLVFCAGDRIAALPRGTQVEAG